MTSLIQAEAENRLREVGLILPSDNVMAIEFGGGPIPVKITLETKEVFIKTNYG